MADSGKVLGYADVAYTTNSYPASPLGDSDYDALALARLARRAARVRDPDTWDTYGLANPYTWYRYRHFAPLGHALSACSAGAGCMYCGTDMTRAETKFSARAGDKWLFKYISATCPDCGWWHVMQVEEALGANGIAQDLNHAYGVLRRFDPEALSAPLAAVRHYLVRNPHRLARINPFRFEELLADSLRDYFGHSVEIVRLGGRKDGGIDLKAIRSDDTVLLIQVKRRADFTKRESVKVVRELHGAMLREGILNGMVITTAKGFSRATFEEIKKVGRRLEGYSMQLLPLADVVDILDLAVKGGGTPWADHGISFEEPYVSWEMREDWVRRSALSPNVISRIDEQLNR